MRFNRPSVGAPWFFQRQAATATMWLCMAAARAVDPQAEPTIRIASQISPTVAPPPPSSAGTSALKKPASSSAVKPSVTKLSSASCLAACSAIAAAISE